MHTRTIDGATEKILTLDHAMPAVEVDHAEDFMLQLCEAQDQIVASGLWRSE
jgi:hypothetical protein